MSQLIDFTREQVRILYRSTIEIRQRWADPEQRSEIIELLARGIDFDELEQVTKLPEADCFDLLCYITFDALVMTCKQRAQRLRRRQPNFLSNMRKMLGQF